LNEFGEDGLVDIASDATRMQMRWMTEGLITEEQSAPLAAEWTTCVRIRRVVQTSPALMKITYSDGNVENPSSSGTTIR
jgi:hypothetical protein